MQASVRFIFTGSRVWSSRHFLYSLFWQEDLCTCYWTQPSMRLSTLGKAALLKVVLLPVTAFTLHTLINDRKTVDYLFLCCLFATLHGDIHGKITTFMRHFFESTFSITHCPSSYAFCNRHVFSRLEINHRSWRLPLVANGHKARVSILWPLTPTRRCSRSSRGVSATPRAIRQSVLRLMAAACGTHGACISCSYFCSDTNLLLRVAGSQDQDHWSRQLGEL